MSDNVQDKLTQCIAEMDELLANVRQAQDPQTIEWRRIRISDVDVELLDDAIEYLDRLRDLRY